MISSTSPSLTGPAGQRTTTSGHCRSSTNPITKECWRRSAAGSTPLARPPFGYNQRVARTVVKMRFENPRGPRLFFREIIHDGVKVRVDAGSEDLLNGAIDYQQRSGDRHASVDAARVRFNALVAAE